MQRLNVCLPLLTLFLMLTSLSNCGTYTPTWRTNSSFKCGTVTLVNSATGTMLNGNSVVTYTGAAFTANPDVALGWLGMETGTTTYRYLSFKANIAAQSTTDFTIRYQMYNNCPYKLWKVAYFAKSANITYVFVGYQQTPTTALATGSGSRSYTSLSNYPNGNTVDLTHNYYVMPFITGMTVDKSSSANFKFNLETAVYSANQYKTTYSTQGSTLVVNCTFYYVVYDQTVVQETRYSFMDTIFFIGQNNNVQAYSLVYSAATNYFAGINSFDISYSGGLSLSFSTSGFSLSTNTTYNWVNISTWNHRNRSCPGTFPYYHLDQNLCYDACPTEYYFTNTTWSYCQSCDYTCYTCTSSSSSACGSCLDGSYRTLTGSTCPCNGGYFDSGDRICQTCDYSCKTCTTRGGSACATCQSTWRRTQSGNSCPCNAGYYDTYTSICATCDYTCATCSIASTRCLTCPSSSHRTLSSNSCPCDRGYYQNSVVVCATCHSNCTACTSATVCQSCATDFVLNGTSCVLAAGCYPGYYMVNGVCKEVCGDGYLYELGCDDGNNVNGDGCSEYCLIETDFVCKDGSSTHASVCSYNKTLDFSLSLNLKESFANKLIMSFSVAPQLKLLDRLNFTSLVETNISNAKVSTSYTKGKLTVGLEYSSSIQGLNAQVKLNPPSNESVAYAMKVSSASFFVDPDNNQPADYNSADQYSKASSIAKYTQACIYILFICTVGGIFFGGVLVMEILNSIQILVLLISTISHVTPSLNAISLSAKLAHGYNQFMNDFPNAIGSTLQSVPDSVYGVGYRSPFFYNISYMLIVPVCVLLLSGIFLLLDTLCAASKLKGKLSFGADIFFKDIFMLTVLFSVTNLGYSFGINYLYNSEDNKNIIHLVLGCAGLVTVVLSMIMLFLKAETSFEITRKQYRRDRLSKMHPLFVIFSRLAIGFFMAMNQYSWCNILILVIELAYLTFTALKQPYKKKSMFVRAIVNELVLSLNMVVAVLYKAGMVSYILEWAMILAPAIWTTTAVATLAYLIHQKMSKSQDKDPDDKEQELEDDEKEEEKEKEKPHKGKKVADSSVINDIDTGYPDQSMSQQVISLDHISSSRKRIKDKEEKKSRKIVPVL